MTTAWLLLLKRGCNRNAGKATLCLVIKTKELVIEIHQLADPGLFWAEGDCVLFLKCSWIPVDVLSSVQSSWRTSFYSRKVWHNVKQEYYYLNVNGELSGNKLCELKVKKLINCSSCTVEAEGKFNVMLCSVQMCKVQMQALCIDGWGNGINFSYFSLKMFLLVFLLWASMSWDQVRLQWLASWLARWNRCIKKSR